MIRPSNGLSTQSIQSACMLACCASIAFFFDHDLNCALNGTCARRPDQVVETSDDPSFGDAREEDDVLDVKRTLFNNGSKAIVQALKDMLKERQA